MSEPLVVDMSAAARFHVFDISRQIFYRSKLSYGLVNLVCFQVFARFLRLSHRSIDASRSRS